MKPLQPFLKEYPDTGKSKFCSKWYLNHSWLEQSKSKNAAFWFICRYFGENNSKIEDTYTKIGFNNFKKASQKFKCHKTTNTHKTAIILYLNW